MEKYNPNEENDFEEQEESKKQSKSEYIITRHSIRTENPELESKEYPGLTKEGVELAKERAEHIEMVTKLIFWYNRVIAK